MGAREVAALVSDLIDRHSHYLSDRFGDSARDHVMGTVTLKCLKGHSIPWDPDQEDFPDGCDILLEDGNSGETYDCGARFGNVEEIRNDPAAAFKRKVGGHDISNIVSPDAETTTNERGGMQSHAPVRFDLIDAKALFATAAVLHEGAEKYAPGNWRLIPVRDHLNHLLMHVYAYLDGDRTDEHLSHAVCRAIFALGVELDPEALPEKDSN